MKNVCETVEKKNGNFPKKILQFGEGNFLRAFADWMIDEANDSGYYQGSVILCQPILQGSEMADMINGQNGIYTLVMRGIEDKKPIEKEKVITSVTECINAYKDYEKLMEIARSSDLEVVISNTTEAGIVYKEGDQQNDCPPGSFPAKVCALLYERFLEFKGDPEKGLLFLPVELIDNNGTKLKEIVLRYAKEWALGEEFITWVNEANKFTNTLVDRIVTGYPGDQKEYFTQKLGYEDNLLVTSELFNLWVIEGDRKWADILPIHKGTANVIWTDDVTPYKMRKVRILNGGHTATAMAAYLAGHDFVLDFMNDEIFGRFLNQLLFEEVIPTIPLPREELNAFADAVCDRFANPYIKHNLLDISLNSCSKFNARCIPSFIAYVEREGRLPKILTFALAALIYFYKGRMTEDGYMGKRPDGTVYPIKDDEEVLTFFEQVWKLEDAGEISHQVLQNKSFWGGKDMSEVKGLEEKVAKHLEDMKNRPVKDVIRELL